MGMLSPCQFAGRKSAIEPYNHPAMTVTVRSFAKINIGLRIGAARADGFHELLTVYQTIGLHDVIRVSVKRGAGTEIRCSDPRVPRDETNTCFRMVERTMRAIGARGRVVIEIEKRLPVQGGMGGASSNAVATLLGSGAGAQQKLIQQWSGCGLRRKSGPIFLCFWLAELCWEWAGRAGVSAGGFASDSLRRGDARGRSVDAESICSVGPQDCPTRRRGLKPNSQCDSLTRPLKGRSSTVHLPVAASNPIDGIKIDVASPASDRMGELGRRLSAWLSKLHSGAPSARLAGRGRAENPLLALVRAGIENDFEQVVFPEYPKLGEGKQCAFARGREVCVPVGFRFYAVWAVRFDSRSPESGEDAAEARLDGTGDRHAGLRRQYWSRIFDC
jgi:4-diphosphocytidyl-2-C-methyl-D-erythritol kinase